MNVKNEIIWRKTIWCSADERMRALAHCDDRGYAVKRMGPAKSDPGRQKIIAEKKVRNP